MVDDDDMIFHTLNGLPTEFDPIKSAIGAQRDLKFHELVSILKSEESRIHKSKGVTDSTSVFVATQKLQVLRVRRRVENESKISPASLVAGRRSQRTRDGESGRWRGAGGLGAGVGWDGGARRGMGWGGENLGDSLH
ncbi:hypothetical protein RHGRI_023713 [Rhododendron griersonianum]|uniref:Uncharacterized protein n=1 Tax=Rhododendron griersonianum TaxID=479676 RepID=A0AAV6J8B1_9ERIC|nr:hypothetical protein RHGRI_023713 [Rhododendron griersonianum]